MIERVILIGMGEVGRAHYNVLSKKYKGQIFYKDKGPEVFGENGPIDPIHGHKWDLMLIATQCDPANMQPFYDMVCEYQREFKPGHIDILTTTPCGACDRLQELIPTAKVTKSSIRGLHPNLDQFLYDIPKHIGGPGAEELAKFYEKAGIECICHKKAKAPEISHALNNFIYGVNILAADECARYCREAGVDYYEFLKYRESQNYGFLKAGFPSKVSPILYPMNNGKLGGHCVAYSATTIPEERRGPLAKMIANYNKDK